MNDTPAHPGAARRCSSSPRSPDHGRLPRRRRLAARRRPRRPRRAVFGPVERVAAAIAGPVGDAVDSVGGLGGGSADADRLTKREPGARAAGCAPASWTAAGPRSSTSCSSSPGPATTAWCRPQVIAIGAAQTFSWTVTLDAGSRDGIRPDMTVLNGDGLVGRVTTVGPSTVDRAARRRPGVVGRRPARGLDGGRLRHRPGRRRRRRPATSSCSTARPASSRGRPAGHLRLAGRHAVRPRRAGRRGRHRSSGTPGSLTRTAVVAPFVDFTSLDLVGVVVEPPRKDPRDAVLPPTARRHAHADGRRSR